MDRLQEDVTILMILCLRDNSCQEYTKKKKKKKKKTQKKQKNKTFLDEVNKCIEK